MEWRYFDSCQGRAKLVGFLFLDEVFFSLFGREVISQEVISVDTICVALERVW